jgi:galactokinase
MNRDAICAAFLTSTGHSPEAVAYAPGRVNLIGEHTDYNDGFVLPAAVDRGVAVAGRRLPGEIFSLLSIDLGKSHSFTKGDLRRDPEHAWANYFKGVVWALEKRGLTIPACQAMVTGNLPQGAGLSSSAAYEVATVLFLQSIAGFELRREDIAKVAREAENGFVGVACGIMDQMAATFGEAGRALLLDCRSLARETVSIPAGLKLVVVNSGVRHSLASSEYNQRRAECEEGMRILAASLPDIRALRDVTLEDLIPLLPSLPQVVAKRCRHVVTENARVIQAVTAMSAGHTATLKKLMAESHDSLRDDYQVSCPELDVLVELALPLSTCHGARMTGGGFGGCTVNLVEADAVAAFAKEMEMGYLSQIGRTAEIHVFEPSYGARLLSLS